MIKIYLIVGLIIAVVSSGLIYRYIYVINENKRLTGEINAANSTIKNLDEKDQDEKAITKNEETILKEIKDAPNSNDGLIIDNAIDNIERLRQSRSD